MNKTKKVLYNVNSNPIDIILSHYVIDFIEQEPFMTFLSTYNNSMAGIDFKLSQDTSYTL